MPSARRCASAALDEKLPIVIQISVWDRPLFYAALPGSTSSNFDWARRKINVVKMFLKSTYRMVLEQQRPTGPSRPAMACRHRLCAGRRRLSR